MNDISALGKAGLKDVVKEFGAELLERHKDHARAHEIMPIQSDFRFLYAPQLVELSPLLPLVGSGTFVLTPYFDRSENLKLVVSETTWRPPAPPISPWTVKQALFGSDSGICIVLADIQDNLLVLTGVRGQENLTANGQWRSTLLPLGGDWSSKALVTATSIQLPEYLWWTLVLNLPNNPIPQSVILQLEQELSQPPVNDGIAITVPYQLTGMFPKGWNVAGKIEIVRSGMALTLTDPQNTSYRLNAGSFTGGIGHLVCQGDLTPLPCNSVDLAGAATSSITTDGGTWTGTSGGPMTLPPPTNSTDPNEKRIVQVSFILDDDKYCSGHKHEPRLNPAKRKTDHGEKDC